MDSAASACGTSIAEIGALLSPVISGLCRDSCGRWGPAIMLDGALMAASCLLIVAVRAARPAVAAG